MPATQPFISDLADRTGWTEDQILTACGAAFLAGSATAVVLALRVTDVVLDALPRTTHEHGRRV